MVKKQKDGIHAQLRIAKTGLEFRFLKLLKLFAIAEDANIAMLCPPPRTSNYFL